MFAIDKQRLEFPSAPEILPARDSVVWSKEYFGGGLGTFLEFSAHCVICIGAVLAARGVQYLI